jgi:hypothetical protein
MFDRFSSTQCRALHLRTPMNKAQQRRFDSLYQRHLNALSLQDKSRSAIDVYARAVRCAKGRRDRFVTLPSPSQPTKMAPGLSTDSSTNLPLPLRGKRDGYPAFRHERYPSQFNSTCGARLPHHGRGAPERPLAPTRLPPSCARRSARRRLRLSTQTVQVHRDKPCSRHSRWQMSSVADCLPNFV